MTNVQFLLGYPVEFKQLCLIYPPRVKDIVSNKNYNIYLKLLTLSQEDIEDEYNEKGYDLSTILTPFEYILNNVYNSMEFRGLVAKAFSFFIHEPVIILCEEKEIIIGDLKETKSVDQMRRLREEDYFEFQNLIRESVGLGKISPPNPDEHPRIKAMKAKARYRDKIKAKSGKSLTLKTIISSICCMNMGLNPLNIGELSYAAIPVIMSTYQEKEKYELDVDSLLAGADSKKIKPKYWIRNLDD